MGYSEKSFKNVTKNFKICFNVIERALNLIVLNNRYLHFSTGIFALTDPHGLDSVSRCTKSGFHPHPTIPPLFEVCLLTTIPPLFEVCVLTTIPPLFEVCVLTTIPPLFEVCLFTGYVYLQGMCIYRVCVFTIYRVMYEYTAILTNIDLFVLC